MTYNVKFPRLFLVFHDQENPLQLAGDLLPKVIFLFFQIYPVLEMWISKIYPGFPDRTVWRDPVKDGWRGGLLTQGFGPWRWCPPFHHWTTPWGMRRSSAAGRGATWAHGYPSPGCDAGGGPLYHQTKERKGFYMKRYFCLCINITNNNNFVIQLCYKFVYMYLIGLTLIFK